MEDHTLRSKLLALIQKSRKAVRLYNNVSNLSDLGGSAMTSTQVLEWKNINAELVKRLSTVLDIGNGRKLVAELFGIRDYFLNEFQSLDHDLAIKQKELITAAQIGDYVKCFAISSELVSQKARIQAAQAAHHELELILKRYKPAADNERSNDISSNEGTRGRFVARSLGLDKIGPAKAHERSKAVSLQEKSILVDQENQPLNTKRANYHGSAKVIPITKR